jgi:putative ABC transport system permease protein
LQEQLAGNRNSAMVQVTNGMFTLSFLLSLVICSVGFLLYWIMTLKKRELLLGVYRAMGMRMGEVRKMILTEQLFASAGPVLAGGGIGAVTTLLFVRLLMVVYLPQKHNLTIEIYIYPTDLLKLLAVLLAVMLFCYLIIRKILRSMKIAKALRLGEDS